MVAGFRCFVVVVLLGSLLDRASGAESTMVSFLLAGKPVEGAPIYWANNQSSVLTRDGRWISCATSDAQNLRRVSSSFRPFAPVEMRSLLQQEFGSAFDVSADAHYLVVHPRGQRAVWAPRFEQLYRSFQQYFTARGWRPNETTFPLVAVVFPTEELFRSYASREGSHISANTLGYYSPATNRILLYDATSGTSADWSLNAETIIHEAAHQTAFNTGVHNRFSPPPRWVAEGLGTMFEARGVWDSSRFRQQSDRINRYRCDAFKQYAKTRRPTGMMATMISHDRMFDADAEAAYAEAWALTFFLSETDPRRYVEYLKKTAAQPNFAERRGPERLKDFTSVFGDNLQLLEAKMVKYIVDLK